MNSLEEIWKIILLELIEPEVTSQDTKEVES